MSNRTSGDTMTEQEELLWLAERERAAKPVFIPQVIGVLVRAADHIAKLEAGIGKACESFYVMPALNGVPEHFGRQATVDEVRTECSTAIDECLSILEPLIGRRPWEKMP